MGSPRAAGSTSRSSSGMRPGSTSATARRPPPARRTLSFAGGSASRSSSPRLIVERARPVIRDTMARPPHPAVRTSAAANNRRPRSSSLRVILTHRPTVSQRYRIAPSSIMQPAYARAPKSGIPASRNKVRFSYCSECPKSARHIRQARCSRLPERARPAVQPQERCGHARGANATRQRVVASCGGEQLCGKECSGFRRGGSLISVTDGRCRRFADVAVAALDASIGRGSGPTGIARESVKSAQTRP